ncbi:MAG TPA: hypothetical protein VIY48_20000 [Candidatus Paceibacterota bacterium]
MRKPVKSVIWACAITLAIDLVITEAWMDMRPFIVGVADAEEHQRPHWLPRCDMEDGKDIDLAILWLGDKPKCVDLATHEIRS